MKNKVQETKPNMVIQLQRLNPEDLKPAYMKITHENKEVVYAKDPLWKQAPDSCSWLITVQAAFPEKGFTSLSFGAMLDFMEIFLNDHRRRFVSCEKFTCLLLLGCQLCVSKSSPSSFGWKVC